MDINEIRLHCSNCGKIHYRVAEIFLVRLWPKCCGSELTLDVNSHDVLLEAADNLKEADIINACGEKSSDFDPVVKVKLSSIKQEVS